MSLHAPVPMKAFAGKGARILARPIRAAVSHYLGVITRVETDAAVAALTFDDGPHPEYTPALLSILEQYHARATFFMIGELAQKHPEVVKKVAAAGHAIGNHSWNHLSFPLLTASERREQLRACQRALGPDGQRLFRPPYCHQSVRSRWTLLRMGYEVVAFSVHAEDWLVRDAGWMADKLIERVRPGSIVILHDNIYRSVLPASQHDRAPMLRALDRALEKLHARFEFVTVPDLLRHGRIVRENWYRRGSRELRPKLDLYLAAERRPGHI